MKTEIKNAILDTLFRMYYPLCLRVERIKAVRLWRDGVRQCNRMYHDIGAPRVYLFFDAKHFVWAPMTFDDNKKMKPSLRRLRIMGKLRGENLPVSIEDMKEKSYYFTASKWGAKSVEDFPHLKERKLRLWVDYYTMRLSEPLMKCRSYLQGYRSRHPQRE